MNVLFYVQPLYLQYAQKMLSVPLYEVSCYIKKWSRFLDIQYERFDIYKIDYQ